MRPFCVQKPNFSGDYPEAAVREGADDLTLRAEEVKTLNACVNIDHIEENTWAPPLRCGLARFLLSKLQRNWKARVGGAVLYYREMSKATGAKKPSESQKAKSPLDNEGGLGQV